MLYTPFMKETALITGASGGLGEEFAKLCAKNGMNVVLIARRKEVLDALSAELMKAYNIKATVIALDLSASGAVHAMIAALEKEDISITMLINNAGFGSFGKFHETSFEQEEKMIAVNIQALTALTKALLPGMVARKNGKILNVASTASFIPGPLMSVYYASKAYVLSFSLGIREELKRTGVTVTCLCPGPTKTGFETHANLAASKLFKGSYVMDASTVAKAGYKACLRGKAICIPGILNKVSAFAPRLIPRTLAAIIAKKVQSPI